MEILEMCADIKNNIETLDRKSLQTHVLNVFTFLNRHYPSTHSLLVRRNDIVGPLSYMNNNNQDVSQYNETLDNVKIKVVAFLDGISNEVKVNGLPDDKVWAGLIVDITNKELYDVFRDISLVALRNSDNPNKANSEIQMLLKKQSPETIIETLSSILSRPEVLQSFSDRLRAGN